MWQGIIYIVLKYFPTRQFTKGKRVTLQWTRLVDHHVNQMIKTEQVKIICYLIYFNKETTEIEDCSLTGAQTPYNTLHVQSSLQPTPGPLPGML